MIDPLIVLAFSVYSNKGTYALLLGSGISRTAQIPTGWDVVRDLTIKVAALMGEDASAGPEEWYVKTYQEMPDYSKLLKELAKSQTERQRLLREYFEPTEEERERNEKTPTAAHRAIAQLVARSYIKIIITTNFDRLLEQALDAVGIVPDVISNPDQLKGAVPLQHSICTIIKIHGDYIDTRIRNTVAELKNYEPEMNKLLDRVFDEYGLIISGWSGDWDIALRAAIERCVSRRFTTYWTSISEPSDIAKQLITNRRGIPIRVENADAFFAKLTEKVIALEDLSQQHPLSGKMAVASLKRYLVDDRHRIALHDLVMGEVRKVINEITPEQFPLDQPEPVGNADEITRRVRKYEGITETLLHLFATGCYWAEEHHARLWTESLTQIANHPRETPRAYKSQWKRLAFYPGLLLTYAGGIGAIIRRNYQNLAAILLRAEMRRMANVAVEPVGYVLVPNRVMEKDFANVLPGRAGSWAPVSDEIFDILKGPFDDLLSNEEVYDRMFNLFEAFHTLVFIDFHSRGGMVWAEYRRFGYPYHYNYFTEDSPFQTIITEAEQAGAEWEALKAGFFNGSMERFEEVKALLAQIAERWQKDIYFGH